MRLLVVHAHPSPTSFSRAVCSAAEAGLRDAGHDVTVVHLDDDGFRVAMTAEERLAYHSDQPILDPMVARHADLVRRSDGIVFVYPTWWAAPPAILKGWLERVMVPGVAFHLDQRTQKVQPDLRHIRRLVGITTYGSPRLYVRVLTDPGRRTITRALGTLCSRRCRRRWLALYGMDTNTGEARRAFLLTVRRRMSRL
jgi:NAD(P)H dehydrogenase (quinone)